MPQAFLSDALMASTMAAGRNRLMQEFNEEKIASQIIGTIAAREGRRETARQAQKGKVTGRAEEQKVQTEIGRTRLGMQKEIAKQQQTAGMITAIASSTAALIAVLAADDPIEEHKEGTPEEYRQLHGQEGAWTREGLLDVLPQEEIALQEDSLQYGQGPGLADAPREPELLPGIDEEEFLEMQKRHAPLDSLDIPEFQGDPDFDEEFGYVTPWAE